MARPQENHGPRTDLSFMGRPGIVEMPSAASQPDAQMSFSYSYFDNVTRASLAFQVTPRLSGIFRYSILEGFDGGPEEFAGGDRFDRSFDVSYRFIDEGRYRPAFSVGLQDFTGTGVYSAEYFAASKTLTDHVRVTGGIGWGRLATYGEFTNPFGVISSKFKERPGIRGEAGEVQFDQWFRGPAALFGGIEWQVTDQFKLNLEYSSDAYVEEVDAEIFDFQTPLNISGEYRFKNGFVLSAGYLGGTTLAGMLSYSFNLKDPPIPGGNEPAPLPVKARGEATQAGEGLNYGDPTQVPSNMERRAAGLLDEQELILRSLTLSGAEATVYITNTTYPAAAQAIGRTARAMTQVLPASIKTITVVVQTVGMPVSAVTLQRADLERFENDLDGAWETYIRAKLQDPLAGWISRPIYRDESYPAFEYNLGFYQVPLLFDVDQPIRAELGVELGAGVEPVPGLIFSGNLRQKLLGNIDDSVRPPDSELPNVRTSALQYYQATDLEMTHLTGEYFYRPGPDLYGRVSLGYLERMFGGASAELLWKPVDSALALGAEINYAVQREFEMGFGFQDYDVTTGHASLYYDLGNGFRTQLDAGRYLAGDWGATFGLEREFANGWRVGAFFTLTDVPFDEFGEGSFDKGIVIEAPLAWLSGKPSRDGFTTVLRPVTRDGGARLDVRNRLHDLVRNDQNPELKEGWGRFWR